MCFLDFENLTWLEKRKSTFCNVLVKNHKINNSECSGEKWIQKWSKWDKSGKQTEK